MSWVRISAARAPVRAVCSEAPPVSSIEKTAMVVRPISIPRNKITVSSPPEKIESPLRRGFSVITSLSGGSSPSAMAGRPSVTRLISRIWMGSSGTGIPISMARNMVTTSPMLQESR